MGFTVYYMYYILNTRASVRAKPLIFNSLEGLESGEIGFMKELRKGRFYGRLV